MMLDLKQNWTEADVGRLIASVVDDRDWRLEVNCEGVAALVDRSAHPSGVERDAILHCFFETWTKGTDFVGALAAEDKAYMRKLAAALLDNFPNLKAGKLIDLQP